MEEVEGSSPSKSTNLFNKLATLGILAGPNGRCNTGVTRSARVSNFRVCWGRLLSSRAIRRNSWTSILEYTDGRRSNLAAFVPDQRACMADYYNQEDLPRFGEMGKNVPELWERFQAWYGAVFQEGALSEREKALIALAVAHALPCPALTVSTPILRSALRKVRIWVR